MRIEYRFSPFQCEHGIIAGILGNAKCAALFESYIRDAMFHLSDEDFIAMNKRIALATA